MSNELPIQACGRPDDLYGRQRAYNDRLASQEAERKQAEEALMLTQRFLTESVGGWA